MRSIRSNFNQIAVSAYAMETAINTEQTLDLSLLAQTSDIAVLDPIRESNADEMTGKEEADTIYDMGNKSAMSLSFPKAQPQHFALLYGFGLGTVASAAAGDGYEKTITPMDADMESGRSLPSMTLAQRYGKIVAFQRFASMFVDQVTSKFAKGEWVSINAQLKGTGKADASVEEESITAADTVTELTLAAKGVAGSTAAERLDAIHQIKVELTAGVWTEVAFSAASDATPAVITITAPGVADTDFTYKILYAPDEVSWMTFPARVSQTPLRVSQVTFMIGGTWSGSALGGGREMKAEVNSIEHTLNNNGQIEFALGADDAYASAYFRDGRTQVLTLDREFRDFILQNYMDTNETFGATILAEGALYDATHKYQVQIIFPKLGVLKAPLTVNGKRLAEKGDLTVLEDDTYGSVIVKVKDLAAAYCA